MTKLLLSRKADPNTRDSFKLTPLHVAVLRNKTPYYPSIESYYGLGHTVDYDVEPSQNSVRYLLSAGADVNAISDREVPSSILYVYKLFGTPLNAILINKNPRASITAITLIAAGGKRLECDPFGKQCELSDSRERMVRNYSCDDKKCRVINREKLRTVDDVNRRRFR